MRTLIIGLALLASACGGDDNPVVDAAVSIDAAVDATPDGMMVSGCETLCNCAVANCGQDLNTCLAECAGLPASVRSCRITHCGYAESPGGAATHCPHVAGDPLSTGVPPECIYNTIDAGVLDSSM